MTHAYEFVLFDDSRWGAKTPIGWAFIEAEPTGFRVSIHGLSGHRRLVAHVKKFKEAVAAVAREVKERSHGH